MFVLALPTRNHHVVNILCFHTIKNDLIKNIENENEIGNLYFWLKIYVEIDKPEI